MITQQVSEWQRTTPLTVPGLLFYASVLGALVLAWRGRADAALAGLAVAAWA